MPKKPVRLQRSGDAARGGALVNASDELPNTASAEWQQKFSGKFSAAEALGEDEDPKENSSPQEDGPSTREVATLKKRPLGGSIGHSRGKTPRTIQRRILSMAMLLRREAEARAFHTTLEDACKEAIANPEIIIKPEAERLRCDAVYLYSKYVAVRLYYAYRAAGHTAMGASDEGGWTVLVAGSTVRRWAADFASVHLYNDLDKPKAPLTFSPSGRGSHKSHSTQTV